MPAPTSCHTRTAWLKQLSAATKKPPLSKFTACSRRPASQGDELAAAVEVGNLPLFELVAKQSQSRYNCVHRESEDEETSLIQACKGQHYSIAFHLLDEGAFPNYCGSSGGFGVINSPLANSIAQQDVKLVEPLVIKGSVVEDYLIHVAVEHIVLI